VGGELHLAADSSFTGSQWIEKLTLSSSMEKGRLQNELDVRVNDTLRLDTRTDVIMGQTPLVQIRRVNIQLGTSTWTGGSDSTGIALGRDALDIQHLKLNSGRQEIWADGTLAFQGEEALDVGAANLDLGQWSSLTSFAHRPGGVLNATLHLAGTAAEPRLHGEVDIEDPRLDTVQLERLQTGFRYDSSVFSIQGHLDAGLQRALSLQARVPVELSLADSLVLPGPETPIRAALMVDSLQAGLVNPFLEEQGMHVGGWVDATLDVGNTLGKPLFDGKLALDGGTFSYPAEGIRYRDVVITSRFNNQRLQLERARMRSGEGCLTMEGYLDLPSGNSLTSDSLLIEIRGKDFEAVRSTRLEAAVSPSVTLSGSLARPTIKGDLTIPRASVNVDALREQMSVRSDDPNPPLLVEALRDTISMETQPDTSRRERLVTGSEFYRNLEGTFNIRIPGNTWVSGNDMNFEVQGDLKAIKERELIDLFGTLNVKRGFFQFYGKKFDFEQGEIIFTGGREINPRVHFVIAYMFRDPDRQRQRLTIEVSGRTRQPNFQFRLNEQPVQEKEALSYLMFGKSTNQLNTTEQVTLEERTGRMARSFALDRVSTAVTRALGAGLGLDMVELEAGKSWKSGNVKIGKYITDDLYLSYQRTFAFDKKDKVIDADRIALEYQIMRSLFLQATNQMYNSGFDLIFKKSWR
jgi:autotransporter translocation and assembly factor TamB